MSMLSRESAKETDAGQPDERDDNSKAPQTRVKPVKEIGGRDGPDPTRYGDWEKSGRCIDF